MSKNTDLVRKLTERAFLGGDLGAVDELVSDDFVDHDPVPEMPANKAGFRQSAEMVVGGLSDRGMDFDEYLEAKDGRVVENWLFTGTHSGEFAGMPPSGQAVRIRGTEIWRCDGGKVVEHWGTIDMSDLFQKAMGS